MATGMAVAGVATSLYGLYESKQQADALERQSQFNAQQMRTNAAQLDVRAEEAGKQALDDAVDVQQDISRMIGTQKVNLAAQGIDIGSEVSTQIRRDTERIGAEDVQTLKNNAWKEAWGMKTQAQDLRMQADMGITAGGERARSTMVTGGLSAVQGLTSAYGTYKRG